MCEKSFMFFSVASRRGKMLKNKIPELVCLKVLPRVF